MDDSSYSWATVLGGKSLDAEPCTRGEGEGEAVIAICFISISRCILSLAFADGFLRRTFRCLWPFPRVGIELVGVERLSWLTSGMLEEGEVFTLVAGSGCTYPGEKGTAETSSSGGWDLDLRGVVSREWDEIAESECSDRRVGDGSAGLLRKDLMPIATGGSGVSRVGGLGELGAVRARIADGGYLDARL
jgi:hypothetical protein